MLQTGTEPEDNLVPPKRPAVSRQPHHSAWTGGCTVSIPHGTPGQGSNLQRARSVDRLHNLSLPNWLATDGLTRVRPIAQLWVRSPGTQGIFALPPRPPRRLVGPSSDSCGPLASAPSQSAPPRSSVVPAGLGPDSPGGCPFRLPGRAPTRARPAPRRGAPAPPRRQWPRRAVAARGSEPAGWHHYDGAREISTERR